MPKLWQSLNLSSKFIVNQCYSQDMKSLKMVGLINQVNGLYTFMIDTKPTPTNPHHQSNYSISFHMGTG